MPVRALNFDLDDTLSDRQASIDDYISKFITMYFPEADANISNIILTNLSGTY
ncbi:hypothetical protein ACFQ3J_12825 [Paenibacillus provencensis]|uniref:Hydrolase of the HAD superfamily n=1 Tax=Paenibacillus provencensis TaxID=441151 RepID=A0ABW3PVH8_9BACL|nr:hypothetical protein [Paenibacillus sp. MER 78]